MKTIIKWKRNKPNTVVGESITITYTISSFNAEEIEKLQKSFEQMYGDYIVAEKKEIKMKNRTIFKTHNCHEVFENFRKFTKYGTTNVSYNFTTGEYIVELVREAKSSTDLMRQGLVDIKLNYDLTPEEIDALDYADSAIKTLIDMGIIK